MPMPLLDQPPGMRVSAPGHWPEVQESMRSGQGLAPLLPLGSDAGWIWIPKNGCSTLKKVWLQIHGRKLSAHNDVHGAVLPETQWLKPEELQAISQTRKLVTIWREPIERFVSACRSHLRELQTDRVLAKLQAYAAGNPQLFEEALAWHHQLYQRMGVESFNASIDPVVMMNQVALQLERWIPCHLDFSHHVIPQVCFTGSDPRVYTSVLGMEQITELARHWSAVSGVLADLSPEHVSASRRDDPFRALRVADLQADARASLERFYVADWRFLELAQVQLGPWRA